MPLAQTKERCQFFCSFRRCHFMPVTTSLHKDKKNLRGRFEEKGQAK
jgi:hypothetical protein